MIRAVLFDVGGPINTEIEHERRVDAAIRAALVREGVAANEAEYAKACAWAVEHFAPDAHTAIIWRLTKGDMEISPRVYAAFRAEMTEWPAFELRDGITDVLAWLHGRGLRLGLAANQPHATLAVLDEHGIGQYFHHREVSGTHGFHKPDVRLFLRCCEDLGVTPEECIMVGDRIDNDIAPARALGMRTVLFRTGRHAMQQPRSADEVPDVEARNIAGLRVVLELMLDSDP
jgi:HAD superfamily hydrolase (TIGR01549 family)